MKKRLFCMALLLALILPGVVFAAGQGPETGPQLTKIKGVFDIILTKESGSDQWAAEFKKLTGVEIEIIKPPHSQYPEILGATFASGDLPDLVEIQTGDYLAYAKSGKLVPLENYIKQAPFFKSVPAGIYESCRLKDGHIYGVPLNRGGGCIMMIRKDWLDKLGLKVPTTYAELLTVMQAFRDKDPDGNGQKDTIPLTLPMNVPAPEFDYYNRFIMHNANFWFAKKGGKWVDGFTEPEFKAAMDRFQKLYKDGLIDSEFFSNKTSTARSKIYQGQAGMMEYWSGTWANTFDESAKNANPSAKVIPIAPIKETKYINRIGPIFSITTGCKNPVQVFKIWWGTMLDKGAGQMLFTYGVEGVHYKKVGSGYEMLPALDNPDRKFDKSYIHPELEINDWKPAIPLLPLVQQSRDIHMKSSVQLYIAQGGDNFIKYVGEINALKFEIFSKIVKGDMSVDDGLKAYKEKAAALKMAEIIKELNT